MKRVRENEKKNCALLKEGKRETWLNGEPEKREEASMRKVARVCDRLLAQR